MRVRLSERRYVYPDISISCDERDQGTNESLHFPRLAIEVLSPGTEAYDRGQKFIYYRNSPSIEEYMLVETRQMAIDVYRRAATNLWTLHLYGHSEQVELASLNISIPIEAIYERIAFADKHPQQPA